MIRHRDWIIQTSQCWIGYEAVHDAYDPTPIYHDGEFYDGKHPVIFGNTEQDCIEQIDDWYEENEDD